MNNFRISMGKNLSDLFKNDKEYILELIRLWREMMSVELNYNIEPIEFTYDDTLDNNIVQVIDTRIETLQYIHQDINNNIELNSEVIKYYNSFKNIDKIDNLIKIIIILKYDSANDKSIEWLLVQMTELYKEIDKQENR